MTAAGFMPAVVMGRHDKLPRFLSILAQPVTISVELPSTNPSDAWTNRTIRKLGLETTIRPRGRAQNPRRFLTHS